jgi:hypothetical protein
MHRQADASKIAHSQSKCGRFVGDPTEGNLDIDSRDESAVAAHFEEFTTGSSLRLRYAAQRPTTSPPRKDARVYRD